jgi:hypothetical protein
MALSASKAVWAGSRATGNARLVLLALADFANEEEVKFCGNAEAWPSQSKLAHMCRCRRSTVQEALKALVALGEIENTGRRKRRGTIVWKLHLHNMTDFRSGQEGQRDDLTDLPTDMTDLRDDLTDLPPRPDQQIGHEPVVKPEVEPEVLTVSSSPSAAGDVLSSQEKSKGKDYDHDADFCAFFPPPKPPEAVRAAEAAERAEEIAELKAQLPAITSESLRAQTIRCMEALEAEQTKAEVGR